MAARTLWWLVYTLYNTYVHILSYNDIVGILSKLIDYRLLSSVI